MKRIEAQSLRPGDTFEYEYDQGVRSSPNRRFVMKRDTVKANTNQYGYPTAWAQWFTIPESGITNVASNYSPGDIAIRFTTEIGQNLHGYVELDHKRVVILIEDGDE